MICSASCTTAWISASTLNGGHYHATQICNSLGYGVVGTYGGTCGTVCGYCNGNLNSCSQLGAQTFGLTGNCGSDANGLILCTTVHWTCTK